MAVIGHAKCCLVVRSISTGELAACHFEDLESSDLFLAASSGAILAR